MSERLTLEDLTKDPHNAQGEVTELLSLGHKALERKVVDNDREDAKVVVLEHKLKASEEGNEEYKKQIVELQKKIKDMKLREEMGKLGTME
jgi:hypothetical protein